MRVSKVMRASPRRGWWQVVRQADVLAPEEHLRGGEEAPGHPGTRLEQNPPRPALPQPPVDAQAIATHASTTNTSGWPPNVAAATRSATAVTGSHPGRRTRTRMASRSQGASASTESESESPCSA